MSSEDRDDPQARLPGTSDSPVATGGYDFDPHRFTDQLTQLGIAPDHLGKQPGQIAGSLGPDDEWWRFEVMQEYWYFISPPDDRNDTEIAPIQFRVQVHTVGEPSLSLRTHLRRQTLHRVPTLFQSDPYPDGYLRGFFGEGGGYGADGFKAAVNTENTEVSQADVQNLGIIEWYAEVYNEDGDLRGRASGFADPFQVRGDQQPSPPQQEEWSVRYLPSRNAYEVRPPEGASRRRLEGLRKSVLVNGQYVGQTVASGSHASTFQIKREYQRTPPADETGRRPIDRETLKDMGMYHQELTDKGTIYKISETADTLSFVTSKRRIPYEWDPVEPDAVDPSATGAVAEYLDLVADDEPTLFDIREDEANHNVKPGPALGYYDTPAQRQITTQTEFDLPPPPF